MNPILRNILVLVGGLIAGSIVNISLVNLGPVIIPLPEGADISDMEKLAESMSLFRPINFLFPFLGHAVGTFVGAYLVGRFAVSQKLLLTMLVGVFFLAGGISAVNMLGGPMWFNVTDLTLAYIPMALKGAWFSGVFSKKANDDEAVENETEGNTEE